MTLIVRSIGRCAKRLFSTYGRPLRVLGIETSCDDTSAAIVTSDRQILSEVVRGQQELHEPMGGIVPTLASKGHSRNLPGVIVETLDRAGLSIQDLDAIAVTRGPGLPPCLPVGLNAAKTLAAVSKKPLIGVHHMVIHMNAYSFTLHILIHLYEIDVNF
jgi:N6-L-threonylcarbamoyladenine synthase